MDMCVCELEDDGTAKPLDLSSILANECERTLTENPFSRYSDSEPRVSDNLRRWNIQYREVLPDRVVNWTTSDTFFAMNGGLPQHLFLEENYTFFSTRNATNSILSYQNSPHSVIRGERVYLSWYNYSGVSKITKLSVQYFDQLAGSTATKYLFFYEVPSRFCVTFPVSPQALGLTADVLFYVVSIEIGRAHV